MARLRISDLSREAGVGIETVRFYQRKKLLNVPSGPAPAGRHYDAEDVRRIRFIRKGQAAGFSLREIDELIRLDRTQDREHARGMALQRIASLDIEISRLREARESLDKLARACEHGKAGPCPILASFD